MNQADVSRLISKLRIKEPTRLRKLKNPAGPEGRLLKLRKLVTALVKHERIELNYNKADEARLYTERLISEAIRHGDTHATTMETVDFWMLEKQLVHKVFKVLVPRFEKSSQSYTRMYRGPREYPGMYHKKAILEIRGNPFPPLVSDQSANRNLLHNILLDEARKEYRKEKYALIADSIADLPHNSEKNETATPN